MLAEFRLAQDQTPVKDRWRTLTRSRIAGLSVAAGVLVALVIAFHNTQGASVAWGEVLAKVQEIRAFTYRHQWTFLDDANHPAVIDSWVRMSRDFGLREDKVVDGNCLARVYLPWSGDLMTEVIPATKNYVRIALSKDAIEEFRRKTDPRTWIEEFLKYDHTDLGTQTLDGQEVQGIEVNDPRFMAGLFRQAKGRLWVAVRTELPVRVELEGVHGEKSQQTKIAASGFNWNVPIDANDFEPNIPADFTPLAQIDTWAEDTSLINGLRVFADLTGGQYPSTLDALTAWREVMIAVLLSADDDPNNQTVTRSVPSLGPEVGKEILAKTVAVVPACGVYGKLMNDAHDVAYHGSRVMRGHPDLPLLRWRQKDGQYRVVFGDLHIETLPEPRLRQLEQDGRFLAVMAGPRGPMPIQASGRFTGSEHDRWEITAADTIEALSEIALITWSVDRPMTLRLPFAQARLEHVTFADANLPFTHTAEGVYEVNVPVDQIPCLESTEKDPAASARMQVKCRWSVPLSALYVTDKGYLQTPLKSLIPIRPYSTYVLEVSVAPDCGYQHPNDPSKREWMAFSMGVQAGPLVDFGTCGLVVKKP